MCIALASEAVAAAEASQLRLVLRLDGLGPVRESALAADGVPLSLRLVQRLVALVEGTFTIERRKRDRMRLTIALPLAIEESPTEPTLDLAGRSVLIATEDGDLARILAETLARWNSDPRWPEDINIALNDLSRLWQTRRRILIVDGRERLLSALSLAHNAALLGGDAPHVVLIAEETQLASLGDVDEGEIAGFVPAPVTPALLANALDALPLEADRPAPITAAVPAALRPPAPALMAPILAQAGPEPLPEPAAALDPRAIDGLRALVGDPAFLGELIGTFRIDARRIMERIDEAAAAGNTAGFAQSLQALLGGTELCELLASLQGVSAGELRERGAIHVRRVDSELDRLTTALAELRLR